MTPTWIPDWATHVRRLHGGFWVWEFSGGATVQMAFVTGPGDQGPTLTLDHETLAALLTDVCSNVDRYKTAIAEEKARIAGYDM